MKPIPFFATTSTFSLFFLQPQVIFILSAINYSELDYKRPSGVYTYPQWAVGIGWTLAVVSALWIPIYAVYKVVQYWYQRKVSFRSWRLQRI